MDRADIASDGGFGTFLETIRDLDTRIPKAEDHQSLTEFVDGLTEDEVRKRFVRLLEAINPNADCGGCSELDKVEETEATVCAYHSSRAGWIIHQARQLMRPMPEA